MNPVLNENSFRNLKTEYPDIVSFSSDSGQVKISAGWLIEKCGWKGNIKLDMTELGKMIEEMPERAERIIRQFAIKAEDGMKQRAAYDTRAMSNSIYTVTDKQNGFSAAAAAARQLNPGVTPSPHPDPPPFTAFVGPCVEYAVYVEYGHHSLAARPFVTPGALAAGFFLEKLAPELFE